MCGGWVVVCKPILVFSLSLGQAEQNGSQKGITGQEFGSQIALPDRNLALKYHYRTRIGLFHLVMIFESPIPVR